MNKPMKVGNGWRIRWLDAYNVRRSETYDSKVTAASALKRHEIEVEDIRSGRARPRSELTLREAAGPWLKSREPAPNSSPDVLRIKGKRHAENQRHLNMHVLPTIGDLRLPEVTPAVVTGLIKKLEGTKIRKVTRGEGKGGSCEASAKMLQAGTIATVLITLRKFLNDQGYPVKVKYKIPETAYGWIKNPAEVGRFLEECSNDSKRPWFRIACELAVYSGLRLGEVAGLKWDSVSFDLGYIHVHRSYDGPTKSKHVRMVPLAPELAEQLKRWRLKTGADSVRAGGYVVAPGGCRMWPRSDLGKAARRACARAGVPEVTYHQLRHTAASMMAMVVSPVEIAAILGHADLKTTMRYVHTNKAALARDPRLHLTFKAPEGNLAPMSSGFGPDLDRNGGAEFHKAEKTK